MSRKKVSVLVAVAVILLSMFAASALAFAQDLQHANPHASCVGQGHAVINQLLPGNAGTAHKFLAHQGLNGESMTFMAHAWEPGSATRSVAAVIVGTEDSFASVCEPG